MMRELDPTLITEEFAKSVAIFSVERFNGSQIQFDIASRCDLTHLKNDDEWRIVAGRDRAIIATIGQFYTACRLFGVTLKD